MIEGLEIRTLDQDDLPYALSSWREGHKQAPKADRMPWVYYKAKYGPIFRGLLESPTSLLLGAYIGDQPELLGFLVATPGKRISSLHWVYTKFKNAEGVSLRRHGVMTELLSAADLGPRFIYTLLGRRESGHSHDETLVRTLAARGQVAVYTPLLEWIK